MTASFQFSALSDISSDAIKVFERGWCSHVDIVWEDGSLLGARSEEMTIGGVTIKAGVQFRPPGYAKFTRVVQYVVPFTPAQQEKFENFLSAQVGKPYDTTAILAFPFDRNWREPDSWFCSELAMAAAEASGIFLGSLSQGTNHITPRDAELVISTWATARYELKAAA